MECQLVARAGSCEWGAVHKKWCMLPLRWCDLYIEEERRRGKGKQRFEGPCGTFARTFEGWRAETTTTRREDARLHAALKTPLSAAQWKRDEGTGKENDCVQYEKCVD